MIEEYQNRFELNQNHMFLKYEKLFSRLIPDNFVNNFLATIQIKKVEI